MIGMINRVMRMPSAVRSRWRRSASSLAAWSVCRSPASARVWVGFGFPFYVGPPAYYPPPAILPAAGLLPAAAAYYRAPPVRRRLSASAAGLCAAGAAVHARRSVLHRRRRGLPDGAPDRVRLRLLLHDRAGPRLGPRDLMAGPPGAGPPEQATTANNPRDHRPAATDAQYAAPIEDYALIGDCHSAALVSRDGSIDWLCWPRFDSPACFAALVGTPDNGRWRIAPAEPPVRVRRQYRPGTLILETIFETQGRQRRADRFHDRRHRQFVGGAHRRGPQRRGRDAARSGIAVRLRLRGAVGDAAAAQHRVARDRRARCRGAAQRRAAARREAHDGRRVHRRGGAARSVRPVARPVASGRSGGAGCR